MGVLNGAIKQVAAPIHRGGPFGFSRTFASAALAFVGLLGGCQGLKPIESHRLIEHQALIDFSGLKPAETYPAVKANGAVPVAWEAVPLQKSALYTYHQWKSPSTHTGVGAAHISLPLPFGADTVLWFARREYTKKANDGKVIGQWTDDLGRTWFEAENDKYHVRGYCLAQGFEAWVVFFGYDIRVPPEPAEISLAARCADTFVPLVGGVKPIPATTAPKAAPTTQPSTHPVAGSR